MTVKKDNVAVQLLKKLGVIPAEVKGVNLSGVVLNGLQPPKKVKKVLTKEQRKIIAGFRLKQKVDEHNYKRVRNFMKGKSSKITWPDNDGVRQNKNFFLNMFESHISATKQKIKEVRGV